MKRKHPRQVFLDADEVERVHRIKVAQFYGKFPHEVDQMPEADFSDTLSVLWSENQK